MKTTPRWETQSSGLGLAVVQQAARTTANENGNVNRFVCTIKSFCQFRNTVQFQYGGWSTMTELAEKLMDQRKLAALINHLTMGLR